MLTVFHIFFTGRLTSKFAITLSLNIPPHLKFVLALTCKIGDAENARLENAGLEISAPYSRGWKMRDWNYRHQTAGVESAGLENSGTGNVWNATCGIT